MRVVLILPALCGLCRPTVFSSSLKTCQDQCSDHNLAFPLARGETTWNQDYIDKCGYSCRINSCHHGCHDFDEPISKCDTRCVKEEIAFDSCSQGCYAVEHAFLVQIQELINQVSAIIDVVEDKLRLKWIFPYTVLPQLQEVAAADVLWFTQSREIASNTGWKWTALTNTAFRNATLSTEVLIPIEPVLHLQVRLALCYRNQVGVSHPVTYQMPFTATKSVIEVISQLQVATDKLALCWNGSQTMSKFKISLATLDGNALSTEETHFRCHLFKSLPKENCCRATISDLSREDGLPGSETSVKIEMIQVPASAFEEFGPPKDRLLFSSGSHLYQLRDANDYLISEEPIPIAFEMPQGELITAVVGISYDSVVVGSSRGGLWLLNMEYNDTLVDSTPTIMKESNGDGHVITQIEYDAMQQCVYAVVADRGVVRCTTEGKKCSFLANSDSLNPIRQIAVDGNNGFIYFLGADHQIYRSELFPINAPETFNFPTTTLLTDLSPASALELVQDSFELIVALKNGTVLSQNLVSGKVTLKRSEEYPQVIRMCMVGDKLYWLREKCGDTSPDEMCFFTEEKNAETGAIHFSRYLYSGKILDFALLRDPLVPPILVSPEKIGLVVSDSKARITWLPPVNMPFQATNNGWRNISYDVKMVTPDSPDSPLVEQTTNGGDVTVSVLPGAEYTASVRACWNRVCSNFVNTINSAFVSFKYPPFFFLKRHNEMITAFDVLGSEVPLDASLSNPFCCDTIFSMDNTTKTWYYVAPNEGVVHHWKSVEHSVPFAKYLSINFVSVLQTRAILILAASYQIISYRLTGTVEHVVYSCPSPIENCAEVVGLSSDDTTGEIYFAVQSTNGTVALFELNQEDRTPRLLATSIDLPQIRQFLVTHEKVIFVTKEGRVGSCDKKLGSLNINLALSNIDMVVAINPTELNNVFDFLGEVNIGQNRKDEVGWAIEPRQQAGKVLYKMSLFRDKLFVGDAHTEITTSLNFILPPSLLESWSSAQRFDINIAGLSAWTTASVNKTALQAPVKPPTAPTNVRLYATQQKTVDGARAIISFFWSPPVDWNGAVFQYIVNCSKEDGTNQGGPLSSSITHYAFAVKSGKVECTVAAANEPSNIGEYTAPISIDSSELKPLVRLFAIDSTNALIAINNVTQDEPAKRKKRQIAQVNKMEYQAIAFIGNDLFAVRKEHDTIQPLLVQIDTNDIDNIVHKVSIGGDVSKIDALTSDWVGNRLLFVSGMALYQLSLDPFLTTSLLTPKKLIELSTGATDAKQLTFDPFKNNAYLLTRNGSLFSLNLSRGLEKNLALVVPCLSSQTVTWMMTEFAWNRASSPKIYALTWNGLIVVDVEENNKCNEVRIDWNKFGEKGLKAMSAFAIADKLFVFVTSSEMLIYGRETVVPIPIANPPLRQILAVSQSSQPYPERTCFSLPSSSDIQFAVINEGKTGAFIEVVKPPLPTTCQGVSLPQTHYEVYFKRKNSDKVKHIRSFTEKIHIENGILDKETDYDVTVAWLNRYSAVSSISDARTFRTGFGYPSAPRSLQATPITPDTIYLFWNLPDTLNAPIAEIKYKISQQTAGLTSPSSIAVQEYSEGVFSPTTSDSASCFSNPCRVKISNLRPSTEYKFWATAIHKSHLNSQFLEDAEAVSQEVTTRTKDIAGTLRPDNVTGSSLLLRWNSLQAEQPPSLISVQYKESGGISEWKAPSNASFDPSVSTILVLINGLLSATTYDYRFVAAYTGTYTIDNRVTGYKEDYYQGVQQAKTKAGVPTAPLMVEARMDDEGWIVSWKEPLSDGGSPITSYAVEMRINKTSEWEIAERGLDGWKLWWRPAKSYTQGADWEFRVRAANQEGFGSYGCSSDNRVIVPEKESSSSWLYVVLGVSLTAVLILLALIFVMLRIRHQAVLKKKERDNDRNTITLEKMAALHHAPYQPLPIEMQNELKNLPHVTQDCIELEKKLGTGSFGEVWEGVASKLPVVGEKQTRVAIKILRSGYEEAEKIKFMKEAILMNNFDHPNIVKLLGVCLNSKKQCLILELMEGGDLLNFLRTSAPTDSLLSQLSLRDLLSMIIDVGRGCAYLETNRHVHRDLAARNCLITSRTSSMRVTKIADFGLARGVYNEEYYRVHGEDFLPLRWLAPESAMEGLFSSKSDIWAFGVLLFEIISLGQKPYAAMENHQVLSYVKNGGTPSKPPFCPDQLYKLMQRCWAFESAKRPSFTELLPLFEKLREKIEFQDDKPFPPSGGHCNDAFELSHDSTSSERNETAKDKDLAAACSFGGFDKQYDQSRFDKSSAGSVASVKKQGRPSIIRSLRKEKAKPAPLPSTEDIDARLQYVNSGRPTSSLSNDASTAYYDCGSSSHTSLSNFASSYRSPGFNPSLNLPSNLSSYEQPLSRMYTASVSMGMEVEPVGEDNGHSASSSANLSRSWAGTPHSVSNDPIHNNQLTIPSQQAGRSSGLLHARKGRAPPPPNTSTSSYDNPRRSRVSQV